MLAAQRPQAAGTLLEQQSLLGPMLRVSPIPNMQVGVGGAWLAAQVAAQVAARAGVCVRGLAHWVVAFVACGCGGRPGAGHSRRPSALLVRPVGSPPLVPGASSLQPLLPGRQHGTLPPPPAPPPIPCPRSSPPAPLPQA